MKQKTIKTIIVEDEPLARSGLEEYVKQVAFLDLCALCENAMEANNAISLHRPDLMFLDIQMPRITGIEFLKSLQNPPMVVFTTAYPNYALQGFELDVVDYLVKPYPFDRFLKATNKALDLFMLKNKPGEELPPGLPYMFVKTTNKLEKVVFKDVIFVEAMENYMVIHTAGQKLMTMMTMKNLEETLPATDFIRIHKSFIINIEKVDAIDGNEVIVSGRKLPLSRQRKQEVLERILGKGQSH